MSKLKVNDSDIVADEAALKAIDTSGLADGTIKMLTDDFFRFYLTCGSGVTEGHKADDSDGRWLQNNFKIHNVMSFVDDAYDFSGNNATEITTDVQGWTDKLASLNVFPILSLAEYKQVKYDAIDAKTIQLIGTGFVHDSETFSLSLGAQTNWHALKNQTSEFTFPKDVSTKGNNKYSLTEANVSVLWAAGKVALDGHLTTGRDLKKSVFDAVDEAGVDAVVDNRQL